MSNWRLSCLHFSLFRRSPQPGKPAPALAESRMRLKPGTTFVILAFVIARPSPIKSGISGRGNPVGPIPNPKVAPLQILNSKHQILNKFQISNSKPFGPLDFGHLILFGISILGFRVSPSGFGISSNQRLVVCLSISPFKIRLLPFIIPPPACSP
jgi:hypothetical protein